MCNELPTAVYNIGTSYLYGVHVPIYCTSAFSHFAAVMFVCNEHYYCTTRQNKIPTCIHIIMSVIRLHNLGQTTVIIFSCRMSIWIIIPLIILYYTYNTYLYIYVMILKYDYAYYYISTVNLILNLCPNI